MEIKLNLEVTDQDIDDIMCSALEGGIDYWCHKVEIVGRAAGGGFPDEQISKGNMLRIYEEEDLYETLDKGKFMDGLKMYLENPIYNCLYPITNSMNFLKGYGIDPGMIDSVAADAIIQYALFGKQRYA